MKIEHKPTQITTSKQFTELSFGIKQADMGLVLEILRSKMYKNPIGAICREVASNSRDANREAENNVPIEIAINDSALSSSDLTISFRDNGHGISPERMADVFVNYGSSTKRDTDEFTGGCGLGAKTPFSYADNFSIETVVNGTKYSYVAAIEEGSKGKIYLINSQETTECSGTNIIIPIKNEDRQNFEKEVYKATIFWSIRPIYKNFRKKFEDIMMESVLNNENFLIVQQDLVMSGYGLLLDGIFYPIDSNEMNFAHKTIHNYLIIFKFNVGDLTISANRETLQYNDKTKEAINKKFVTLINLCKETYETEFKKNTTWFQAALFHKRSETNLFYNFLKQHARSGDNWFDSVTKFDNMSLTKRLDSIFQMFQFYSCRCDDNKVSRTKTTEVGSHLTNKLFFFDENQSYVSLKDAMIFKNNKLYIAIKVGEPKLYKWDELSFKEKKGLAKSMRAVLDDIELITKLGFTYSLYSSVEKLKVVKDPTDPTAKQTISRVRDGLKIYLLDVSAERTRNSSKPGKYNRMNFNGDKLRLEGGYADLDTTKYCVQLVDDVWQEPEFTEEMLMLQHAMKLKLVPEFTIIYANKNRGRDLTDILDSYEERSKLLTPDIITQIIDGSHVHEIMNNNEYLLNIVYKSKTFGNTVKILKDMVSQQKQRINVNDVLKKKYEHLSKIQTLKEQFEKMKKSFPLLEVGNYYSYRTNIQHVTQYINLIEDDMIRKGELQ
jgi:hypothetical protein